MKRNNLLNTLTGTVKSFLGSMKTQLLLLMATCALSSAWGQDMQLKTGHASGGAKQMRQLNESVDAGDAYQTLDGSRKLYRLPGRFIVREQDAKRMEKTVQPLTEEGKPFDGYEQTKISENAVMLTAPKMKEAEEQEEGDGVVRKKKRSGRDGKDKGQDAASEVAALRVLRQNTKTRVDPVFVDPESGLLKTVGSDIILRLKEGVDAKAFFGNEWERVRPMPGTEDQFILTLEAASAEAVLEGCRQRFSDERVKWAEPDFECEIIKHYTPSDTHFNQQWHLKGTGTGSVRAETAWNTTKGENMVIAIVDSGVQVNHPDLAANIFSTVGHNTGYAGDVNGWDFYSGTSNVNPANAGDNHGTAVAGVAAAVGNNGIGVAGAAFNSKILPVKVSSDGRFTSYSAIASSIRYAAGLTGSGGWRGADVINCSWGGGSSDATLNTALSDAATSGRGGKGCPIFFSSGNDAAEWYPYSVPVTAGTHTLKIEYKKDASVSAGLDRVWLDCVSLPGNGTENFEGTFPPSGWSVGGNAGWVQESDAAYAFTSDGGKKSARSGTISHSQTSTLSVTKTFSAGNITLWLLTSTQGGGDVVNVYLDNVLVKNDPGGQYTLSTICYPASHASTIAIGASTDADIKCDYSQYGTGLDFVTPSGGSSSGFGTQGIYTTDRTGTAGYNTSTTANGGDYYNYFNGTSSSSPLAAGIGALILSKNPNLTAAEVRSIMRKSCDKVGGVSYSGGDTGAGGWNTCYGYGRINAATAIANTPALASSYTVTVSASPAAGGTVSGGGTFASGSLRTVTASASSGYTFQNWTEGSMMVSASSSYEFTLTGNRTLTANFTVTPTVTTLQSGVSVSGISGNTGSLIHYKVTVPPGMARLVVTTTGGTGDADVYVKRGSQPTTSSGGYDARGYTSGNNETVTVNNPASGDWYIALNAYSTYSGVTLTATYSGYDLQFFKPSSWPDSLFTTDSSTSTSAKTVFTSEETIYLHYAFNDSYSYEVLPSYVDRITLSGPETRTVFCTNNLTLPVGYYMTWWVPFANLPAGSYTAKVEVNYNRGISETNYANNEKTVTFTVTGQPGGATLTVNASPSSGGTVTGGGTFTAGSSRTITATPNTGWRFTQWNDGNTSASRTVTVPAGGATYTATFAQNTYTVAYNGNGNTGGSTASSSHTYGTLKGLTANGFTKTGYSFAGWATSAGGTVAYADGVSVLNLTTTHGATVTLYARWTAGSATLTVNASPSNGGTVTGGGTFTVGSSRTITATPNTGWRFTQWNDGNTSASRTVTVPAGGATYTATFAAYTYTVTFDPQSGTVSPASKTVTFNAAYGELPTPTRAEHAFAGWFTATAGGTQVTAGTIVAITANQTLYARWTATTTAYTVTFNGNGGTPATQTRSETVGQPYVLPAQPVRANYAFTGWFTAATGGTQVTDATTVTAASTHTLYAQWAATHMVIYYAEGGMPTIQIQYVTVGQTYDLPTEPTRDGYTFAGWFTASVGGTQVTAGSEVTITADQTLFAHWIGDAYTVTYDANDGTPTTQTTTVTYGQPYVLPSSSPTRTGYTFAGWFTAATGGHQVTAYTTVATASAHTLYARWTGNAYVVSYAAHNGIPSLQTRMETYGQPYVLPATPPKRDGYTFSGWFTEPEGGIKVTVGTAVATASAHTLYAQWALTGSTYTVVYDGNGGTPGTQIQTATVGQRYALPAQPTRANYFFAGWFTAPAGGTLVTTFTTVSAASAHTLYARWEDTEPPHYLSDPDDTEAASPTTTTAYDGFVYDNGGSVRGTMTLTVKESKGNWTFSAKAILQNATVSFSAKAWSGAAGDLSITNTKTGETLALRVEGDRFYGTVSGGKIGGMFHVDGARNVFADKAASSRLDAVRGLYNVALLDGSESMGYLSLTVGNLGSVKIAGKLADGTSVSGSAKLLAGLNDDGWYAVALYKPLYSKKGFIGGLLWLNPVDKIIRVDSDYGWFVGWVCDDSKKTRFAHDLNVLGGYFGDGKTAPAVSGISVFSASVPEPLPLPAAGLAGAWMDEAFPWEMAVTIGGTAATPKWSLPAATAPTKSGEGYNYSGANPSSATLTYTAKTGLFKGSFKLYFDGVDAKGKAQHKTASVSYNGVVAPVEGGGGFVGLGSGTATINKQKVPVPVFFE